ncbi:D-sedoheptulose-7-phosphate isomerase [Longispora urticae]
MRDLRASLDLIDHADLAGVVLEVVTAMETGGRVLVAGNGGSSSTAAHMCGDLNAAAVAAAAVPGHAVNLADNVPALTAIANDVSYDQVFARQIPAAGRAGDVFVAVTVSGASPNLLEAARTARQAGLRVVSLLGRPGPLRELSDRALVVGDSDYGLSEDLHLAVNHMMVRAIRKVRSHTCQRPVGTLAV